MATEPAGSDGVRGGWVPFACGLVIGGAAVGWLRGGGGSQESTAQLQHALRATLERVAALESGAATPPRAPRDGGAAIRTGPSGDSLAGKPIDEGSAVARRRTGVDESSMAKAIERADRLSAALAGASPAPVVVADASPDELASASDDATGNGATPGANDGEAALSEEEREQRAEQRAAAAISAFNRLLADAGVEGWRLLEARLDDEGHRFTNAVLAQRGMRGTAIGSLIAESLRLERDPITGIAALLAEGAHGVEGGVDVAYEGERYRIEIPGVLPVELVPSELRGLFALSEAAEAAAQLVNGDSAVALINRALSLEKGVALRLRSAGEVVDGALTRAVVDLAIDSSGQPTQTVLADLAWFEVDVDKRYAELCCEGGEMVEDGQKRPLFRGRLRVPLRDLTPEHWKGVPAVRRTTGS